LLSNHPRPHSTHGRLSQEPYGVYGENRLPLASLPVDVGGKRRDPGFRDHPVFVGGRSWERGGVLDAFPTSEAASISDRFD
jgi:hypothetical protein